MLSDISSRGFSKFKKVTVGKGDVMEKEMEAAAEENTNIYTLIICTGTNDLTNNMNTLRSVKKVCEKANKVFS